MGKGYHFWGHLEIPLMISLFWYNPRNESVVSWSYLASIVQVSSKTWYDWWAKSRSPLGMVEAVTIIWYLLSVWKNTNYNTYMQYVSHICNNMHIPIQLHIYTWGWFFGMVGCIQQPLVNTVDGSEIRRSQPGMYKHPANNGINYLSTGAFLPSTVSIK